jgi:hypothetical protein
MTYQTQTVIQMTPDQLEQLVERAVQKRLDNYTPPAPIGADLPDLLTRKQTAETLQVSLTTLHEWAKDTDDRAAVLVPRKINGRVRYQRADVLNALKESRRFKKMSVAGESQGHVC